MPTFDPDCVLCRVHQDSMEHFESHIDDGSDCGGWRWDPPCGGCAACIAGQVSHADWKSHELAAVYRRAGLRWAPMVEAVISEAMGFVIAPCHDGMACHMAEEREGYFFPWERKC